MRRRALLLTALATPALAQPVYPDRPIRFVVPFPPAGGTDVISREITGRIAQHTGWTIVAENRPGAGGNIGLDAVAKAAPDGYTLGMGQASNLAINPALYPNMPYDPLRDLAFVSTVATQPTVVVTGRNAPWQSVAEVIADARRRPGVLTAAHTGNGTVGHLAGELFARVAGVEITQIPYRGASLVITDILARRADLYFANLLAVRTLVEGGELRVLAVAAPARSRAFPQAPTLGELGLAVEATNWTGIVAPRGAPDIAIARWNAEIRRALATEETLARLAQDGSEPLGSTPEAFRAFAEAETAKWGRIVREARIEMG